MTDRSRCSKCLKRHRPFVSAPPQIRAGERQRRIAEAKCFAAIVDQQPRPSRVGEPAPCGIDRELTGYKWQCDKPRLARYCWWYSSARWNWTAGTIWVTMGRRKRPDFSSSCFEASATVFCSGE